MKSLKSFDAQKIQDKSFKKMTASQKIKLVGSFFRFGQKLNKLNGNRRLAN